MAQQACRVKNVCNVRRFNTLMLSCNMHKKYADDFK